jgi:hypothetical protein
MPRKPVTPEFDPETNEPLWNWTKHSNRLIDLHAQKKLKGQLQLVALMRIAKQTWGHEPKRPWTRLVVTKEAEKLGCTREALTNALKDAEDRKLIESKKLGNGRAGTAFRLTQWKDVPDPPPDKDPEPAETDGVSRNTMVLLPGHSGTLTVEMMVNGQLAKISVKCHNTLDQRATFQADPGKDGEVIVSILERSKSADNPKSEIGEQKADQLPSGLLARYAFSSPEFIENKEVNQNSGTKSSPNGKHGISAPVSPPVPLPSHSRPTAVPLAKDPAPRREFEDFVTQLCQEVWDISIDLEFLHRIVKLADGLPVEAFNHRLVIRFGRDYRRLLRSEQPGLLPLIVRDALRDHRASEAQRKAISAQAEADAQLVEERRKADAEASFERAMRKIKEASV